MEYLKNLKEKKVPSYKHTNELINLVNQKFYCYIQFFKKEDQFLQLSLFRKKFRTKLFSSGGSFRHALILQLLLLVETATFADILQNRYSSKFRNIQRKVYLYSGLFSIKLQTFRTATLLKRDSSTGDSYEYCEIYKNSFFIEHLHRLLYWIYPLFSI